MYHLSRPFRQGTAVSSCLGLAHFRLGHPKGMANSSHTWKFLAFYSLLALIMGVFVFSHADRKAGIVPDATLVEASGRLASMQDYKYGTRFGLMGYAERFDYLSKAGGMGKVRDALRNSGDKIVHVRYAKESYGPLFSDEKYHGVWVLAVGEQQVRSYAETAAAWEADNKFAPLMGLIMTVCGLSVACGAWHARQAAQQALKSKSLGYRRS
jgi:hypothetical protein